MLSRPKITDLLDRFVVVKIDPRESRTAGETFRRYARGNTIPQIALLDPEGNHLRYVQSRDVEGMARELREVLARYPEG